MNQTTGPVYVLMGSRHDNPIAIVASAAQALEWMPADITSLPMPEMRPGMAFREYAGYWRSEGTGEFFRLMTYDVWTAADKV
jgi:hypothetical protein